MSCEVYANSNEVACKAGDGKVIAAFPDVCLTPPPPPAGPIPIPYPDSSFSKDMQSGSKTVMIKNKEVMLKDQSFYKTSPLGDEAATNGQGASVITHVITGKTYFNAWSMDVMFEGANADRHIDLTTSNHASGPPGTPPNPNLDALATAATEDATGKCECCKDPEHPAHSIPGSKPMDMDTWYTTDKNGAPLDAAHPDVVEYKKLRAEVDNRKPACTCNGKVQPSKPCNVFRKPAPNTRKDWSEPDPANPTAPSKEDLYRTQHNMPDRNTIRSNLGMPADCNSCPRGPDRLTNVKGKTLPGKLKCGHTEIIKKHLKINHLTPVTAGGCPICPQNLQNNGDASAGVPDGLCDVCRGFDERFTKLQDNVARR